MKNKPPKTFFHTLPAVLYATYGYGSVHQFRLECKHLGDSGYRINVALINLPRDIAETLADIKPGQPLPSFGASIDVEVTQAGIPVGDIIISSWNRE